MSGHPNRLPFSGILTRIDEPSDTPPNGANGKRIILTMQAARKALDSLLGMPVDITPDFDGHDPTSTIGVIDAAEIRGNAIHVRGTLFAVNFPIVAKNIQANAGELGFSFEAQSLVSDLPEADPVPIAGCVFTGAAILRKDLAAYRSTELVIPG